MPTIFLVKGFVQFEDKEKRTLYVGPSAQDAFSYFDNYSLKADMIIEIWEKGSLVKELKQKHYVY